PSFIRAFSNLRSPFQQAARAPCDHYLSRRSASVRRESLRRSSSAIQLLTVLTISRSLCRSVFSERSTGKVFDLLFLPCFRTVTPEFITSSRFYSMSLNQPREAMQHFGHAICSDS